MNPAAWLKLIPVAIEGITAAVGAFTGKHDGYETQARIDRIRARGAANRALRSQSAQLRDTEDGPTKREKPPKE